MPSTKGIHAADNFELAMQGVGRCHRGLDAIAYILEESKKGDGTADPLSKSLDAMHERVHNVEGGVYSLLAVLAEALEGYHLAAEDAFNQLEDERRDIVARPDWNMQGQSA